MKRIIHTFEVDQDLTAEVFRWADAHQMTQFVDRKTTPPGDKVYIAWCDRSKKDKPVLCTAFYANEPAMLFKLAFG